MSREQRLIHLLLQDILSLKKRKSNRSVFQEFFNENLLARWRDNYWGAIPTALIIEQVLTRSLKSNEGFKLMGKELMKGKAQDGS